MATVRLRAPLSEMVGGRRDLVLEGASVADVLAALEREHPALAGWILDEQGAIRRHVNVFVNGQAGGLETRVGPGDRVHVLPAITGGSA